MNRNLISFLAAITVTGFACKKARVGELPEIILPKEKKWVVTTVAGNGIPVFADGPALASSFRSPLDVAVAADGVIYVADAFNHRIRKIAEGLTTTLAGNGTQDTTNGNGVVAGFGLPGRLTTDVNGNLYVLDAIYPGVRKITPAAFVTRYAGTPFPGFRDGDVLTAQFGQSFGIITDAAGNIYVADSQNDRIRKISANGRVTTIAGNGTQGYVNGTGDTAQFFFAAGLVIDSQGNLLVADLNHIRKITPEGIVSTFAGNDAAGYRDGPATTAQFTSIEDMVIDDQGNIYVSDENRIRKITSGGDVSTIAGSTSGYKDGDGLSAKFNIIQGLGIDRQGNIYAADVNNHRIRKISFE